MEWSLRVRSYASGWSWVHLEAWSDDEGSWQCWKGALENPVLAIYLRELEDLADELKLEPGPFDDPL